jgi:hypothetical protein
MSEESELLAEVAKVVDGAEGEMQADYQQNVDEFLMMPVGSFLQMLQAMNHAAHMVDLDGLPSDVVLHLSKPGILSRLMMEFIHERCQQAVSASIKTLDDAVALANTVDLPDNLREFLDQLVQAAKDAKK